MRGEHILDPHTGRPPAGLLSVTITGDDLGTADAYATAAFAMGEAGPGWTASLRRYEALCILADGRRSSTPGFPLARPRDRKRRAAISSASRRRLFTRYIARSAAASSSSSLSSRSSSIATTPMLAATSILTSPAVTVIDRSVSVGLRRDLARLPRGHVEDERRELVAAEAPDHVGGAQPAAKHLRGRPQHLVAGEVAGGVVHELEVVEVEQEQRAVLALPLHPPQLATQPLHEPAPVEEPRERVVVGEPAELALGLLAVADVLDLEHVVERARRSAPRTRVVLTATQSGVPSARR